MTWRLWPLCTLALALATATPVYAFDCGKATTKVERAICADTALKSADDAMNTAYVKLKDSFNGAAKEAMRISQLRWIKRREACDDDTVADLGTCIGAETGKRMALLRATPETGPGDGGDLAPWFIQKEGKNGDWDIDLNLVRFADPRTEGESLFNREAETLAAPSLLENSTLGTATIEVVKDQIYAKAVSLSPTYASKTLISALAEGYEDTGGAHGNSWRRGITIALHEGRRLTFAELFPRDVKGILSKLCNDQLVAARKVRTGDATMDLEEGADLIVLAHIKDLERWAFWADHAVLMFDPYELGSYSEGPYECRLEMGMLRTLALPDAPLPK
jgi:uncharacterized protein YecT (DUF1311 family)